MFLKLLYTLTIGITLTGLTAEASLFGGTSGGGGGAYVCRDKYNQIINSELLDLWEAKKLAKLDISRSEESIEIQIERALSKFPSHYIIPSAKLTFLDKIKNELKIIQSSAHRLDDSNDISLQAPTDSNTNYQKRGCPLEGMMFYDGELGHVVYIGDT